MVEDWIAALALFIPVDAGFIPVDAGDQGHECARRVLEVGCLEVLGKRVTLSYLEYLITRLRG